MITVLAIGKKHEPWVVPGIDRYAVRCKPPYDIRWKLLPHSSHEGEAARTSETTELLKAIAPTDYVVLLDETGRQLTSPALATLCEQAFTNSHSLVFVIGGAYGVDRRLHERANRIWSLSDLVFPHQLVRLILTEQLYRAQEISRGGMYHHA